MDSTVDGSELGISVALTAVESFLKDYFFPIFQNSQVPIGLAILLLSVGGLCVLFLRFRKYLPIHRRLKSLERLVSSSSGQLDFVRSYPEVDEAFKAVPFVRHGWAEFTETLIFPDPTEEGVVPIYNTARPSSYINLSWAETSGIHLRFLQAVPNYFVGLGLLFTFVGLVAAIYFASQGIASTTGSVDVSQTQASLQNLLNAATFKFLTSIAGIGASLWVAITYRLVARDLQWDFDSLCEKLEERLAFVTPEDIAFRQVRELQKQSVQLERFNTELAVSIADALDARISTSFAKAVEPLVETMNGMAEKLGDMNQNALSTMLDQFTEKLNQGAGTEMQALAGNLAETQSSLRELAAQISTAGERLSSTVGSLDSNFQEMATSISGALTSGMAESMEKIQAQLAEVSSTVGQQFAAGGQQLSASMNQASDDARKMFQPLQEHIDDFAGRMEKLSEQLNGQIDNIRSVNEKLGEVVTGASTAARGLSTAVEPFRETSAEMSSAAASLAKTSASMLELQSQMGRLAQTIEEAANVTTASWTEYAARFENVDQALGGAVEKMLDGTKKQNEATDQFVRKLDAELQKAVQSLAGGIQGLTEGVEELNDGLEDFLSKMREHAD